MLKTITVYLGLGISCAIVFLLEGDYNVSICEKVLVTVICILLWPLVMAVVVAFLVPAKSVIDFMRNSH